MDTLKLVSNGTVRIDVNGTPLQAHLVEAVRHLGSVTADAARAYVDVDLSGIDLGDHFHGRSDHTWAPLDDEDDDVLEDPMLLGTFAFDRHQYEDAIATAKLPELSKRRRLFRRVGEEGLEPPTVRV